MLFNADKKEMCIGVRRTAQIRVYCLATTSCTGKGDANFRFVATIPVCLDFILPHIKETVKHLLPSKI
jgi:hypothetical protein